MIRNSIKYLPYKDTQTFINDLKQIYKAATESEAENNLLKLQEA
jgi:transposase-like protein